MEGQPGLSNQDQHRPEEDAKRPSTRMKKIRVDSVDLEELVHCTLFEDDDFDDVYDSDKDPDYVEESEHDSASEQGLSDEETGAQNISALSSVLNEGVPSIPVVAEETEGDIARNQDIDHNTVLNENQNLEHVDDVTDEVIRIAMESDPNIIRRGDATYYYGRKNKEMIQNFKPAFKWKKTIPNQTVRTRQHNIITQLPGLKPRQQI
jgi:hypothetical protein